MSCIKLKKLEEILQGVDSFEDPKIKLEQYETPSHIASQILFTIQNNYGDLEGKLVGDLGCGAGMLSIGAAVLGAGHVVGFEIDQDAIEVSFWGSLESQIIITNFPSRSPSKTSRKWNSLTSTSSIAISWIFSTKTSKNSTRFS
jgi:2-polyprenyl-3-methyl-5-hydroxy-6-metoxy-1,4-benzoquinol methylase